jgi:hypothetical protein
MTSPFTPRQMSVLPFGNRCTPERNEEKNVPFGSGA